MTPFTEIYYLFLARIKSDELSKQYEESPEVVEKQLKIMLMNSALIRFKECKKDLSRHDGEAFEAELDGEEKLILAMGMELEYLNNVIIPNETAVAGAILTKDYNYYSPNAKVKNILTLEKTIRRNHKQAVRRYQYYNMMRGG